MNKHSVFYFLCPSSACAEGVSKWIFSRFWAVILFSIFYFLFSLPAHAATNISATTTDHWAWNDIVGWMDFFNTDTVVVATSATTTGYASSSDGDISLDCETTREGNICGTSHYGVINDGAGNYSGWAWNDTYGWISFWCGNNDGCDDSNYRVRIDAGGNFRNYAWNDVVGWISFNCSDPDICNDSEYRVVTSWTPTTTTGWLESAAFDTGVSAGANLNSVLWQGSQPVDTAVEFQFASSNSSSGPWTFMGTDGTSSTYYRTDPNASLKLNYSQHLNRRYFRYKAFLLSDASSTATPQVDDIFINWSP